ncbi:tuliposide A-converting enzyme 1, chloroplastic [Zea mays]|jgi:acetyl esterase/lipase|uniref:Alpha/beta hydrolase fold-3 domain-containing protein n=1 Tax=Zea mays TaxID=4577 RepID=A0A804QCF4_MAIZE|nr:tuliposide A-converting enzyme 1, chloroplastic [Zea mays]|eukprot:XP_008653975.1 tuliposide A-converting enzyme 1, chloroplastic [Zea mays]
MEPDVDEVVFDAPGYFRIYKNGRVDRFNEPVLVAAGVDDSSGVSSKDVVLDADTGLSVRLFLPNRHGPCGEKLPVLVYFHGGGFIIGSAKSAMYHNYLTALASAAGVLAVSVDYRLAPEHQLPAAYDDCWAALRWAASARDGWIAEHGDAGRVFVAGDSAGGNIVHNVLMKASSADKGAPRIEGAVLLHAFFGGSTAIDVEPERAVAITKKLWSFACRDAAGGADDPRINPTAPGAPALECLGFLFGRTPAGAPPRSQLCHRGMLMGGRQVCGRRSYDGWLGLDLSLPFRSIEAMPLDWDRAYEIPSLVF